MNRISARHLLCVKVSSVKVVHFFSFHKFSNKIVRIVHLHQAAGDKKAKDPIYIVFFCQAVCLYIKFMSLSAPKWFDTPSTENVEIMD